MAIEETKDELQQRIMTLREDRERQRLAHQMKIKQLENKITTLEMECKHYKSLLHSRIKP